MSDGDGIVLKEFRGSDIATILVEREPDAAFSLSITFGDGAVVRLAGARSVPDLEDLFSATWASLTDEGFSQREFGRYLLEFSSETSHALHCDEVTTLASRTP